MIDLENPLTQGYLKRLIGEDGITLIRNMPDEEVTDEEICDILNPLKKVVKDAEEQVKTLKAELKTALNQDPESEEATRIQKELEEAEKARDAAAVAAEGEYDISLNTVRKILFILGENKFTICKRERDSNSGWLTFRWRLNMTGIDHQLEREKKKLYRNLLKRQEYEAENLFYVCPQHCVRLIFNDATEMEFLCPLCGEDLVYEDNEVFKELLDKRVDEFRDSF